jgi:hypothetical protein
MLTDATAANTVPSNVVALDAQLLDVSFAGGRPPGANKVSAAAAYVRATVGVPLSATDLESDVCAGRGPVHRKWGKQRLFRRSDLTAWAAARLSAPTSSGSVAHDGR